MAPTNSASPTSILVDTIPIVPGRTSMGIQVYVEELLDAVPMRRRASMRILCTASNHHLFDDLRGYARTLVPWAMTSRVTRTLTQQVVAPLVAAATRPDVMFEPVDTGAVLAPVPIVTCLHSSHLNMHHGQMTLQRKLYNRVFLRLSAQRASRMIAISEYVKDSTVDLIKVDPDKIEVVYHGGGLVERANRNGWEETSPRNGERSGGILFVSTLYPHKNVEQLLRAYHQLSRTLADPPRLHVVGDNSDGERFTEEGGERARLEALARDLGIAERVTFHGRLSDEDLLDLIATSRLMVYPSLIEGFGLPALEAMQAGLPLIASNRTSLPEIVGDGGVLVDPGDTMELARVMERVLTNEGFQQHLSEQGRERGKQFSWKETARRTLRVLDRAGSPSNSLRGNDVKGY